MGQTTGNPDDRWELELFEDSWLLQLCSRLRDIQNNGFVILFFLPNYHAFLTDNHKDNIRLKLQENLPMEFNSACVDYF